MNSITSVPGAGRGSGRANPPGHDDGAGTDFQFALGAAAALQTHAAHDIRAAQGRPPEERREETPDSETRVASHSDGERSRKDTGVPVDDGAHSLKQAEPQSRDLAGPAAAAAEAPASAQGVAPTTPSSSAAPQSSAGTLPGSKPAAEGTPSVSGSTTVSNPAPAPAEAVVAMLANTQSAEHAAVAAGGLARVVSKRLATPMPVAPVVARPGANSGKPAPAKATPIPAVAVNSEASALARSPMRGLTSGLAAALGEATSLQTLVSPDPSMSPANPARLDGVATAAEALPPPSADVSRAAVALALVQVAANRVSNPAAMEAVAAPVTTSAPVVLAQAVTAAASETAVTLAPPRYDAPANTPANANAQLASAPAPRIEAPLAHAPLETTAGAAAAPRADQQQQDAASKNGGDHARREAPAAPASAPAVVASAQATVDNSGSANAANTATRVESPVAAVALTATRGPEAVRDPRLEPMRRVADQVTLQFQGEDGMEGRLRISVRGDSVRASIMSSHDGTLQRAGSELNSLKRALAEQGFTDAKLSVHDTRTTGAAATGSAKDQQQSGEERRQGEPQRKSPQGRETRQESGNPRGGRRGSQGERRDA